jgi:hypothetical protein
VLCSSNTIQDRLQADRLTNQQRNAQEWIHYSWSAANPVSKRIKIILFHCAVESCRICMVFDRTLSLDGILGSSSFKDPPLRALVNILYAQRKQSGLRLCGSPLHCTSYSRARSKGQAYAVSHRAAAHFLFEAWMHVVCTLYDVPCSTGALLADILKPCSLCFNVSSCMACIRTIWATSTLYETEHRMPPIRYSVWWHRACMYCVIK